MGVDDSSEQRAVYFAGEYLRRYEAIFLKNVASIKEWRTKEFEAGRPSSLADYFAAHGYCRHCHGIGLARNSNGMGLKAVGWDGKHQLYEECEHCGGTGGNCEKSNENPTSELGQ